MEGLIFNIQKFSINDGGGIRTVVFFKGCLLTCPWCSNPESQSNGISKIYWKNRCIGCGKCLKACPQGIGNDTKRQSDCKNQLYCVRACPAEALVQIGKYYQVEDVMRIVERDMMYYQVSGGGITLSGGEPLMQWEFAAALLAACQENCIDTAMETTGFAPMAHLKAVAEKCNRILYDVKHMDSRIHKKHTGVGNEQILANLKELRKIDMEVVIRVPLLRGINDGWENIEKTAELALHHGVKELHLLPYHRYGEPKYEGLGRDIWKADAVMPEKLTEKVMEKLSTKGLKILVGG